MSRRPLRVLVADDSSAVRRAMGRVLEAESRFTVVGQATNGLEAVAQARSLEPALPERFVRLIAIGASTGGPPVIRRLLEGLRARCPPVLITQHMSRGLTAGFANWLDRMLDVRVGLARTGDRLEPGRVYVAPDDAHLGVTRELAVQLSNTTSLAQHRPAVDPMFASMADVAPTGAVGVLLTGMGKDGASGLAALRRAGAFTMAQDPATAAAPSMPMAALELDAARLVGDPPRLADVLGNLRAFDDRVDRA